MKKSFKGIIALCLALALLCAAIPVASAETNDYKGEVFQWDVSTDKLIAGDISKADGYYDYFDVVASEDIVATIQLEFINAFHAMYIDIWEDGTKLYSLESTKAVHLVMEAGKTYSFNLYYMTGFQNDNYGAYTVELSKKSDFTMPEKPTETSGGGYLWNGKGITTYASYYTDIHYNITEYYVAKDTTFNVIFDVVTPWMPDIQIYLVGPDGYNQKYEGLPINATFTLEAGDHFYITFGSNQPVPSGFALNVHLIETRK